MSLHSRYPAISDLKHRAKRRIPHFVWEYLDSATGDHKTQQRNRAMLDKLLFEPSVLHGEFEPELRTSLFGVDHALPFGVAPVGMSGLIWPDAERKLARAATVAKIPYCLSTVATQTPEYIGPDVGGNGWFQLYPPRDVDIRHDMLKRARDNGFSTLVLTVDVPVASRRERQTRSGLTNPPRLTPRLLAQVARCPVWAAGIAKTGMPRMRTLDKYTADLADQGALSSTAHVGYLLRTAPDWEYLQWLRDAWHGTLVVKGVMRAADAEKMQSCGVDGIWVSNHAGRQFDGALSSIEALPSIRASTTLPIIFDSGIEGGLDILRARALGADFVMLARAFHYALGALGDAGPAHLVDMLRLDMIANMGQLGARSLDNLASRLI
ncbi:MAG: alpha-hydroxy acid oxidase [Rhodobacterales bacterium]|nr:alpha-hydroxy acid oxidase [Rhodobacterales bacterium]